MNCSFNNIIFLFTIVCLLVIIHNNKKRLDNLDANLQSYFHEEKLERKKLRVSITKQLQHLDDSIELKLYEHIATIRDGIIIQMELMETMDVLCEPL